MTRPASVVVRISHPVKRAPWPLHFVAADRVALVGWEAKPEPVAAGPPPAVAAILGQALCRVGRVTFADAAAAGSEGWRQGPEGDWVIRFPASLGHRLRGRGALSLCSTLRPERARDLFAVAGFDWSQGAQAVLLSNPGDPPPPLSLSDFAALVDAAEADPAALRLDRAIRGLALPGVDGDYLELVALDLALLPAFTDALRAACEAQGVAYERVEAATLFGR
jgi:hypothetical protein